MTSAPATRAAAGTSRRACVLLLAAFAATAAAQPSEPVRRVGFLSGGAAAVGAGLVAAFRDGLRDAGWVEGRNVVLDLRFAEGQFDRLPQLAAELVRTHPDVVVAVPTPAALAAKSATATIPIVMLSVPNPVELGLVGSLARPGGNVTGVAFSVGIDIIGKELQVLTEAVPRIRSVALLVNPANPGHALARDKAKADARALGLSLQFLEARAPTDFDGVFAAMGKDRADALLVVADSMFQAHRAQLAELALRQKVPSVFAFREYVDAGGLMSYGPNLASQYRQAAAYVDRILRGARPAELPVEQPTKFELVVNARTARALGLTLPPSVLLQASHVVE